MSSVTPVPTLPNELVAHIFTFLTPEALAARASLVSKDWRELALEPSLWRVFIKFFGQAEWEKHADVKTMGLEFEAKTIDMPTAIKEALPLFAKLDAEVTAYCTHNGVPIGEKPGIDKNLGVEFLDIPKNLTLDKLFAFAKAPKQGSAINFNSSAAGIHWSWAHSWIPFLREFGDKAVEQPYRIMITRGIVWRTRNWKLDDQEATLKRLGCVHPKVIEITTQIFTTLVSSPPQSRCQYDDNNYTRCIRAETFQGHNLFVGGFIYFETHGLVTKSISSQSSQGATAVHKV